MKSLGLDLVQHCTDRGLLVRIQDNDDHRIAKVTSAARGRKKAFWTGSREAEHALRAVARVHALQSVALSRWDADGINDADVDVTSSAPWKEWHSRLDFHDQALVKIFRAGAVHSSTRAQRDRSKGFEPCKYCGYHTPSFRHWWAECPRFQADRNAAAAASPLLLFPAGFWTSAPKCTAKSGWITYAAHHEADVGAHLAVATAHVAIAIMHITADALGKSGASD